MQCWPTDRLLFVLRCDPSKAARNRASPPPPGPTAPLWPPHTPGLPRRKGPRLRRRQRAAAGVLRAPRRARARAGGRLSGSRPRGLPPLRPLLRAPLRAQPDRRERGLWDDGALLGCWVLRAARGWWMFEAIGCWMGQAVLVIEFGLQPALAKRSWLTSSSHATRPSNRATHNRQLLCWQKGQGSHVHNHDNSHCWLTCLHGEMVRERSCWFGFAGMG